MTLTIQEVRQREDEMQWDMFVQSHPEATGYHLMAWRKIITDIFGHRTVYLFARDTAGAVRGILPLCILSSRLFGTFAVSLPAVNYGGIVADDQAACSLLLDAASVVARDSGCTHVELRQHHELETTWPCKRNKVSMQLALPNHYDTLWAKYPSKLRSQIRRAQKEGMTTRVAGSELVDDFYTVFSKNMRDLGTPVYGRPWFEAIVETFNREAQVCAVYIKEQPVAAALLYGFRNMLEIPWASSSREHNRLAPNMLLYSTVLQYACEAGYQVFDFGRSSVDGPTYRFKEQWGAQPLSLPWYYCLHSGQELPELNPNNAKYRLPIEVWKRLPLLVANYLGPRIVKYLP